MSAIAGSRSSTAADPMRIPVAIAGLTLLAALAAGQVQAQSRGERIETLESRMEAIERKLDSQAFVEMARQLESQDAEIRRLRGEFEALQHDLERARAQQRDQHERADLAVPRQLGETELSHACLPWRPPASVFQRPASGRCRES